MIYEGRNRKAAWLGRALASCEETDPDEPVIFDPLFYDDGSEFFSFVPVSLDYGTGDFVVRELIDLCLAKGSPVPHTYLLDAMYFRPDEVEDALTTAESEHLLQRHGITIDYSL